MKLKGENNVTTAWDFLAKYWTVIAGILAIGVAWGRMENGMRNLRRDHKELKEEVDNKTDSKVCEVVHTTQRENQDIVLKTIETGQTAIRRDIQQLTTRLDNYINGRRSNA